MARGFPSMTALLGLLAVAGYQNRDKISEWLGGAAQPHGQPADPRGRQAAPAGGALGGLGGLLAGLGGSGAFGNSGSFLNNGLNELIDRFRQNGQGDVADSWIGTGPNKAIAPDKLQSALGPDVLQELSERTGLSQADIVARLSHDLPSAVDRYTPEGRLPG